MMLEIKLIVEQHEDGFIAYLLGLPAAIVGEGDTAEDAIADAQSAIRFYLKHYGGTLPDNLPMEAFVTTAVFDVAA
jgi:predicted RNase H-like HicB family nuclease